MKFLMLTLVSIFALLSLNALDCLAYETDLTQEQPALSSIDYPNQGHCTEVPMVTLPTVSQAGKGTLEGKSGHLPPAQVGLSSSEGGLGLHFLPPSCPSISYLSRNHYSFLCIYLI